MIQRRPSLSWRVLVGEKESALTDILTYFCMLRGHGLKNSDSGGYDNDTTEN